MTDMNEKHMSDKVKNALMPYYIYPAEIPFLHI